LLNYGHFIKTFDFANTIILSKLHYVAFCIWDFVDYNFSHRIINLSFGDPVAGIVNPLEGEEKLTVDRKSDSVTHVLLEVDRFSLFISMHVP